MGMIGKNVLVRTYSAGVHFGVLAEQSEDGRLVKLLNSRRVWRWAGAATLSQLAIEGVTKPGECKIAMALPEILLTEAIEVIPMSKAAELNLAEVPEWKE
jgi:hypothetical protein